MNANKPESVRNMNWDNDNEPGNEQLKDNLAHAMRCWMDDCRHPANAIYKAIMAQELIDMVASESDYTIQLKEEKQEGGRG